MLEHSEYQQYGLEQWELGWLAAAWESEGYFTVVKSGVASFYPRIGVANSDRMFMERIQNFILLLSGKKVSIKTHNDKYRKSHNKKMWRIEINHYATIVKIVEAIIPYLCGKTEVAKLVHELAAQGRGKEGKGLSAEQRRPYYERARLLNRSAKLFNRENLVDLNNQQGTIMDSSETNEQSLDLVTV